ncbi:LytR C-terminal domain-containing protein [Rothia sp. AR01]|uniref:LytR C-terminal domain-containing protein n=1 Tax=Rothia santali TaxID=2949643 RepID=A0A9X2KHX5_9MICC|nr:LytR C-terminal domain-containing protein [Rothia santali]MCP3426307.1 LytR C-terminal domain-containing protein [Rothia santali]
MPEYERDEFDDVPADFPHRGAFRADPADRARGYRGTFVMIAVGVCALVLGGVMFLLAPRTSAPGASPVASSSAPAQSESSSASPGDGSSSGGASPSDGVAAAADPSTTVAVYNNGAAEGSATEAAATLQGEGWTISDVTNWDGSSEGSSVVYYSAGAREQAEAVAEELGIDRTEEAAGYFYQVVVVIAGEGPAQ